MTAPRVALATWSKRLAIADDEDDLLAASLRELGVEASRLIWDRDVLAHDACVIRTTWDYFERRDEFLAWADAAARTTQLWNPPAILRWNSHKRYLTELAEKGVPSPATALLTGQDPVAVVRDHGWTRVIVKPAVGVGALDTLVADADEDDRIREHVARLYRRGDVLMQEYLESVHSAGEVSVVLFDGTVSHAVRKVPAPGDYRAHPYWGATVTPMVPTDLQRDAALAAVRCVAGDLLYARVDLLEQRDGTPAIIELEVIEPYLFLDRDSAAAFARAIVARLAAGPLPH